MDVRKIASKFGLSAEQLDHLSTATPLSFPLLTKGNTKLGRQILSFSLPAILTCPGRSGLCESICYADNGHYRMTSVKLRYVKNLVLCQRKDFVELVIAELRDQSRVIRIHPSGDFYTKAYAEAWLAIAKALPDCRFYFYTRSWRTATIRPTLERLSQLRNVRAWFSYDAETGRPTKVPRRVRLAYMQTGHDDLPDRPDLVFRDNRLRTEPAKRVSLALVCPVENGATTSVEKPYSLTCNTCKLCWADLEGPLDPRNHIPKKEARHGPKKQALERRARANVSQYR